MGFKKQNKKEAKKSFKNKCLFVIVEGYYSMKSDGNFNSDWEEGDLTEQLIYFMNLSSFAQKWKIDVIPEKRLSSKTSAFENKTAKKSPRIDMRLMSWQKAAKQEFYVEAKNLCETNWDKKDGVTVSSSYQLNRYVNTGVKHFISGYYPSNGCLCGYILQGNKKNIIQKINVILEKKALNKLELANPINNHSLIYNIKNDTQNLLNLFFELIK